MPLSMSQYPRGAEWRQWDLHVHTPASFYWLGQRFDSDLHSATNIALVDEMIEALNSAVPDVFALMDYWTFDGWFALKRRLAQPGAPKLLKKVFPGIELRLMAPMNGRLNAHVLFSDQIEDQMLLDFKAGLNIELVNRPLSNDALIALARRVGDDKLRHHGIKKADVDSDPDVALTVGSAIAELSCESYRTAISKVPHGYAIGFMPFNTSDGLAEVDWREHYAFCLGLFQSSPIFETRDLDTRSAFVGEQTEGNKKWVGNFQKALGGVPRLAVSGSDAHCFKGIAGDNNRRGYGDFPSGKATWIKADPTFQGLLQTIMEPAKRSFIGDRPPKLAEVVENKTYFIDSVEVVKSSTTSIPGIWLDGCKLLLNPDLVAVIGNKGSGKSALADVIALLGNSRQKEHFSFLKRDRFRGKSGEPAKHFQGTLTWCDGSSERRQLSDDPPVDKVELVRYIPQGHFEELCNEHVSGRSNAFERELRAVIFSHAGDSIRLGALDFEQLIEKQERTFRDQLDEFRKDLKKLNDEIASAEAQLQPEVKRSLQDQLGIKQRQIDEHMKLRPTEVVKPSEELSGEQKDVATALEAIAAKLKAIDERSAQNSAADLIMSKKLKAVQTLRERIRILERFYKQFLDDAAPELATLGLAVDDVVKLTVTNAAIDALADAVPVKQATIKVALDKDVAERTSLNFEQQILKAKLNAPQLLYQQNLKALEDWSGKLVELTGIPDAPETFKGIEARIQQLEVLPQKVTELRTQRLKLSGDIFDILDAQRKGREQLFKPVQDLIQGNNLIREEYKLQFQATLAGSADSIAAALFALIKQNSGEFRGEDESFAAIKKLAEDFDFNTKDGCLEFISKLHDKINTAAGGGSTSAVSIANLLRKDKTASDVYNLLFGLSFLEPRYSLLFQDTHIEQLSPGQRGALLLIFYLLVDKGRIPIILDQPEENLDNETVVSLLVPVITEAKRRRQIIMVTHNPNLAVVCDAEQVIYSSFDRKSDSKIAYLSGAIESPIINGHVVNILEGTKPAFDNRRVKYQ